MVIIFLSLLLLVYVVCIFFHSFNFMSMKLNVKPSSSSSSMWMNETSSSFVQSLIHAHRICIVFFFVLFVLGSTCFFSVIISSLFQNFFSFFFSHIILCHRSLFFSFLCCIFIFSFWYIRESYCYHCVCVCVLWV